MILVNIYTNYKVNVPEVVGKMNLGVVWSSGLLIQSTVGRPVVNSRFLTVQSVRYRRGGAYCAFPSGRASPAPTMNESIRRVVNPKQTALIPPKYRQ
jgi:hypothetical protein